MPPIVSPINKCDPDFVIAIAETSASVLSRKTIGCFISSSSTNITEDRVYFKIDSTYDGESCPEIIRALTKKTKVFDGEDEGKSRANTPNTPMEINALKALALKILNDEFETELDKYNILFPVGSMK